MSNLTISHATFDEAVALCIEECRKIEAMLTTAARLTPEDVRDQAVDAIIDYAEDLVQSIVNLPVGEDYGIEQLEPYIEEE